MVVSFSHQLITRFFTLLDKQYEHLTHLYLNQNASFSVSNNIYLSKLLFMFHLSTLNIFAMPLPLVLLMGYIDVASVHMMSFAITRLN